VQQLAAILCVLTILWIVCKVLWDHFTARVDLFSARNTFYAGMILFQYFPISVSLGADSFMKQLVPSNPGQAGMIFLVISWLFLLIFDVVYARGWVSNTLARFVYSRFPVPSPNALLAIAAVFLVLGTISRFVIMTIPLINTIGAIFSIGFLSAAAGCAVWAWLPRLWNPIYAVPAFVLIIASILVSTHLSFGRRDPLSVILACMWAAYWGFLRDRGNFVVFTRLGGVASVGVVLLALLSATRGEGGQIRGIGQIAADLASADLGAGVAHMAKVQDSGPVTLYLIDSRPDSIPYDTLHSFKYVVTQPIPRIIWPGKPNALGQDIVTQAGVRGLARGFSYGPGIIGHVANDNPWVALPIYAFLFAVGFKFLDQVCKLQLNNPFVMLPVGSALGEMLAIPRGEIGLFIFRAVFMFLTAWFGLWAVAKLLIATGIRLQSPAGDEEYDEYSTGEDRVELDGASEYSPELDPRTGEPPGFATARDYRTST
jgi:hypothetical protein